MGGKTEMPYFAFLPGRKKGLSSSGWRQNLLDIIHRANGVKLVEIHMIGVETLQGMFQLLACALCISTHRLFCKKDLAAIWLQRFTEFAFRFTIEVRRGTVKIVHASVVRFGDAPRSVPLGKSTDHDATQGDDGEVNSILIRATGQRCRPTVCGGGRQSRCSANKLATIHRLVLAWSSLVHGNLARNEAVTFGMDHLQHRKEYWGIVDQELECLKCMLDFAVKRKYIAENPAAEVKHFNELRERPTGRMLTLDEEKRILDAAPVYLRVAIILLSQAGGRTYSEGFYLRWSQVDFEHKVIRLDNNVKTPGSAEPIPLSQYACDVLQAWKKESPPKSEYVFPSPVVPNRPISTVKTAWKATLRRAGVTAFPIYTLRHVFCTRL